MRKIEEKDVVLALADAVARQAGFYAEIGRRGIPSVAQRLNNPGCMRSWKDPSGRPYPTVMGFVSFPDVETGWRALRAQCRIGVVKKQLSLREFFGGKPGVYWGFAPRSNGDNPEDYVRTSVARLTKAFGVDCARLVHEPIATLIGWEVAA